MPKPTLANIKLNLFADDLICYKFHKNSMKAKIQIQRYIKMLECWLKKWKIAIQGSKCVYIVFGTNNKIEKKKLNIRLFNQLIPRSQNPTFLGVKLDSSFSLINHVLEIKEKIKNKINLMRHLAFKRKNISSKTLTKIFCT